MRPFLLACLNVLLLPLYAFFLLAAFLATWVPMFPTRNGLANLRARMNISTFKARLILTGVFFQYAITTVEMAIIWPLGLMHLRNRAEFEAFVGALAKKYDLSRHGLALLMAHHGHIEEMGEALSRALKVHRIGGGKSELHALAKPAAFSLGTRYMGWYRNRRGIEVLWTDRKDLVRAMIQVAKSGGSLVFVADQKPDVGGIFARFFGEYSSFPYRGPDVAVNSGLAFLHGTARRLWPGCFEILFSEGHNSHLPAWESEPRIPGNVESEPCEVWCNGLNDREIRMAPVVGAFAGWLEAVVRISLTQWCWDYRKWSRKPSAGSQANASAAQTISEVAR